jgi:hypothetical protein
LEQKQLKKPSSLSDQYLLIQPDEIKRVLASSGYLLEGRIGKILQDRGYFVEFNNFQPDPRDSTTAIEIDVRSRRSVPIKSGNDFVSVVPLIECKNNSQPVVFFMRSLANSKFGVHYHYAGFPTFSQDTNPRTREAIPVDELLQLRHWHHYANAQEVATQFCTFSRPDEKKDKEQAREHWRWKVEAMQNYSQSFSSLCVAAQNANYYGIPLQHSGIYLEFYYPIVVFKGPIYSAYSKGAEVELASVDHLAFVHSTSISGAVVTAQLDVVTEDYFSCFLSNVVDRELPLYAEHIERMYDKLLNNAKEQRRVKSGQPWIKVVNVSST